MRTTFNDDTSDEISPGEEILLSGPVISGGNIAEDAIMIIHGLLSIRGHICSRAKVSVTGGKVTIGGNIDEKAIVNVSGGNVTIGGNIYSNVTITVMSCSICPIL